MICIRVKAYEAYETMEGFFEFIVASWKSLLGKVADIIDEHLMVWAPMAWLGRGQPIDNAKTNER